MRGTATEGRSRAPFLAVVRVAVMPTERAL